MLKVLSIIGGLLPSLVRLLGYVFAYTKGRGDVKSKYDKADLKAIRKAKDIRDRLIADDEYAQWVREQFKER